MAKIIDSYRFWNNTRSDFKVSNFSNFWWLKWIGNDKEKSSDSQIKSHQHCFSDMKKNIADIKKSARSSKALASLCQSRKSFDNFEYNFREIKELLDVANTLKILKILD